MANPPKDKGSSYERKVAARYEKIFPEAARLRGGYESEDLEGLPFIAECKHRKRWDVQEWTRKLEKVALGEPWALHVAYGDQRLKYSPPEVVVIPSWWFYQLIAQVYDESGGA